MYKKVKKYNLNTSDKQHTYLMLKNLFTSLLLHKKISTTEKKARSLKRYALEKINRFFRGFDSAIAKKTWLKNNIATRKRYKDAVSTLLSAKNAKIHIVRTGFREGDGAVVYEVKLEVISKENNKNDE